MQALQSGPALLLTPPHQQGFPLGRQPVTAHMHKVTVHGLKSTLVMALFSAWSVLQRATSLLTAASRESESSLSCRACTNSTPATPSSTLSIYKSIRSFRCTTHTGCCMLQRSVDGQNQVRNRFWGGVWGRRGRKGVHHPSATITTSRRSLSMAVLEPQNPHHYPMVHIVHAWCCLHHTCLLGQQAERTVPQQCVPKQ